MLRSGHQGAQPILRLSGAVRRDNGYHGIHRQEFSNSQAEIVIRLFITREYYFVIQNTAHESGGSSRYRLYTGCS
jgi:hypothetical protein